jgi:hypothetical protein
MCRSLYVMQYGQVASKAEAARWAQEELEEEFQGLLAAASAWRPEERFDHATETEALILHTLKKRGLRSSN